MNLDIPEFEATGDLPPGVYRASLRHIRTRFGSAGARRIQLYSRLERIHRLAAATRHLRRFVIFGSFITAKPEPNDIDLFMILDDGFDSATLTGEARLLFDHAEAQAHFGASVFWVRQVGALGGEDEAVAYWQITRRGGQRGIVEVVGDEQ